MWNWVAVGEEVKVNFGSSWEFTGFGPLSHISHAYYLWNSCCEVELWEICSVNLKILKESTSPFPFFFFKEKKFVSIWLHRALVVAHGISRSMMQSVKLCCSMWDPWSGIKPGPPAWRAQSLSYWTNREVPPSEIASVVFLAATWTPWREYLVTGRSLSHKPLSSDPSISSWWQVFPL